MAYTTAAGYGESPPGAFRALRRSAGPRLAGGIAGGLADYLEADVVLVRVVLVALAFVGGFAVPLYLAAWLLVPGEGSDESVAERLLRRCFGDADGGWKGDGTAC